MPGSFVRVTTVTHNGHSSPGTGRKPGVITRKADERDPIPMDSPPAWHWALRWPLEGRSGPCGTAPMESEHSAMRWTVAMLKDYAQQWGANPMGLMQQPVRGRTGRPKGGGVSWAY